MSSASLSNNNPPRRGLIWLRDPDPDGHPLNPIIKDLAYGKEPEIAAYRASEMRDEAEVANLLEDAVYRTSKVANTRQISDPAGYLYRTYANLVDQTLRRTIQAFGLGNQVLAEMAISSHDTEQTLVKRLTRQNLIALMDEKEQHLWERHILGYEIRELAAEAGQDADYLGKRLRRAAERALRRLLLKKMPADESSVSDNNVAHG
jgi:DNA-directed RNA polymerase specialized sigma24 family protein